LAHPIFFYPLCLTPFFPSHPTKRYITSLVFCFFFFSCLFVSFFLRFFFVVFFVFFFFFLSPFQDLLTSDLARSLAHATPPTASMKDCPTCQGNGTVKCDYCNGKSCAKCKQGTNKCSVCEGAGAIQTD